MARRNFIDAAILNGWNPESQIVNKDSLLPKLEPATEAHHQRQLDRWNTFIEKKKSEVIDDLAASAYHEVTSAYDVVLLKDFVRMQAFAIKGTKSLNACVETVRNYWNTFIGAWKRGHKPIDNDTISTVTQFIYGPLTEELGLLREKRPRRYANENHLFCYAEQVWAQDFHVYRQPSTRVNDWGLFLSNVFSTARIGEFIESTVRNGSDRGQGLEQCLKFMKGYYVAYGF
ncbi:hypothetical protein F4805DRAFT_435597 [Annulohypoxylon moriforme]|nr:hypothetical protein F4805DRAFT_435597 [Annulohypoxylon moriforme]